MLKWLLLFLVVFVIYKLLSARTRPSLGAAKPRQEHVVECARCGVYVPQSEVIADDLGRSFCCDDHRLKGPKD